MRQDSDWLGAIIVATAMFVLGFMCRARADDPPPAQAPPAAPAEAPDQSGAQVLTQGPIHEAFAEPLSFDPKPGPVVPKAPPAAINELPPEHKPAGDNVHWIPGYWAWDDARNDYIWVSGVWRAIPPGRQWVPGYWHQVEGGYQWVPGYWSPADAQQSQYLPEPPANLDSGPNSQRPTPDAIWSPGSWVWQDNQYAWQPGYWVENQADWVWNPASYSWTPNGYIYNSGYWDYPLANRGMAFAPTYFSQPIYTQPNFLYSPAAALVTSGLLSSLFVRPAFGSYYFGDYYAPNYFQSGFYPWYSFHGSRYGYDPLYAAAAAQNIQNPNWASQLQSVYQYRRDHPEARPPRTLAESRSLAARPAGTGTVSPALSNLTMARPVNEFATATAKSQPNALRMEQIEQARRQEFARQAAQVSQFGEQRRQRELEARRSAPATERSRARSVDVPRSPITAPAAGQRTAPPAAPRIPAVNPATRPPAAGAPAPRPEPRIEARPPAPRTEPRPETRPAAPRTQPPPRPPAPPAEAPKGKEAPKRKG
jgi:hypothetical protein